MTQGSKDEPADRSKKSFDAAWEKLLEGADDPGPDERAGDDAAGGPKGTRLGDASEVARRAREEQTRDAMDWMMSVPPEASGFGKVPKLDDDERPAAVSADDIPIVKGAASEAGVKEGPAKGRESGASASSKGSTKEAKSSRTAVRPKSGAAKIVRPVSRVEGSEAEPARPREQPVGFGLAANEPPAPESKGGGSTKIVLLACVGIVVAAVGYAALGTGPSKQEAASPRREPARASRPPSKAASRGPGPSADSIDKDPVVDPPPAKVEPPVAPPPTDGGPEVPVEPTLPPSETGDGGVKDPREPPPGTPEEIAAVFRKLPVSPSDRPPVGGVGPNGIHVDRIDMGATYEDRECTGEAKVFSLSRGDRPNVCVRVVHPREKEELVLLWEKKGGATRRGKLIIQPGHAYRTRAYLVLRSEYVGEWTVRIQANDGTELAAYAFTVEP